MYLFSYLFEYFPFSLWGFHKGSLGHGPKASPIGGPTLTPGFGALKGNQLDGLILFGTRLLFVWDVLGFVQQY